ncbi:FAD-dependent oxidoreductase [Roseateles sp. SL47]|uniref:FAD-dependent oxidoreductase n=1 Tax=Roseateles sp. SL47 TaxID=2995138 RepID=UPI00226FDEB3|nr:FAD-dependent oxidoreductase [Roseateles sp. SL47]WAC70832.1 FAD-dependent oxidoreductase [Roseateles sp. SL47]
MTSTAQRVLIIGGGFSGMSAAIALRRQGVQVDLVEIDPGWRSYGAGISLGGATLRAFSQLGILQDFLREGWASDNVAIYTPEGVKVGEIPTPRIAGPAVPGGGAIMRPVLARILARATRAAGTDVRLGVTFETIEDLGDEVSVRFTDGQTRRYDLVIGADGLYSKVRQTLFPEVQAPKYSGQAVWRAVLPRPPEITTAVMWVGGDVKPGVNPVSNEEMYLFVTEHRPVNDRVDPATFVDHLSGLLKGFRVPLIQRMCEQISEGAQIVFRPLEGLLVPRPWHRGRVVLIGDTVHATTPHMASGACIGIEDALVLAEELGRHAETEAGLLAFQARRWERCRMVVENSARLGEIEMTHGSKEEHGSIMRETHMALAQPI